jgi:hypothetical protein
MRIRTRGEFIAGCAAWPLRAAAILAPLSSSMAAPRATTSQMVARKKRVLKAASMTFSLR